MRNIDKKGHRVRIRLKATVCDSDSIFYIWGTVQLCLEKDQLEKIQRILKVHFSGLEVDAYGSRVTGVELTPDSALDIVVLSPKPISFEEMVSVEKAFADSGLPFRVDIVDWAKLTENMQKNIKKEHIVIQEANVSETR